MAQESKIEWCSATWNPWHGCIKVSEGCKYCYMYRDKERYGLDPTIVKRSKSTFKDPLKWNEPRLVFTCSWSDFFIEEADEWRAEAWEIIKQTPHLTYQILTKRPERILQCLPEDWKEGYKNVWLGISAENQDTFDKRMLIFQGVRARKKFVSFEPLLGPIKVGALMHANYIDWAIIGGESGNDTGRYKYRPCEPHWISHLIRTCQMFEIPVFVKQMGTHIAKHLGLKSRHGNNMSEWPASWQIREFPKK